MEPEEAPARETYISGEMMTTIRDDPEKYKQMLKPQVKQPAAQAEATPRPAAQSSRPDASFSAPAQAPGLGQVAAPGKNRNYVILGVSLVSLLILLFVVLWLLKVF